MLAYGISMQYHGMSLPFVANTRCRRILGEILTFILYHDGRPLIRRQFPLEALDRRENFRRADADWDPSGPFTRFTS